MTVEKVFARFHLARCLAWLLLPVTLLFSSLTSASVVPVCTAASGCTPDFNVDGGTWNYTTNGNGTGGTLVLSGAAAGIISFAIDQVLDHDGNIFTGADDRIGAAPVTGDQSGLAGILGMPVTGVNGVGLDVFSMTMILDGSGDVTGGSISLDGAVFDLIHGGFLNGGNTSDHAQTFNGTVLNGLLLSGSFGASAQGGIGYDVANDRVLIGFMDGSVTGGILGEYGGAFAGSGNINSTAFGSSIDENNYLDQNWTATSYSLNIVVPLPAGVLLYASAMGALVTARIRKK